MSFNSNLSIFSVCKFSISISSSSFTCAFLYSSLAYFVLFNSPFSPKLRFIPIPANIINKIIVITKVISVIPLLNILLYAFYYLFFYISYSFFIAF